jgi:hypothetical protein
MSTDDDDITPEPTDDELDKFRRAYTAILDGKVETRLRRMKFGDSETAAIVMTRPVGRDRERVVPLFIAVNRDVLNHLSTMWGEPIGRPETPVIPVEPALATKPEPDANDPEV